MTRHLSATSTAVGAALLLAAAVGATFALNSGAAAGATRPAVTATAPTSAATIYLKTPTIKGPVTLKSEQGAIQLTSLSASFDRPATGLSVGPIVIDKSIDTATPRLMTAATQGTSLGTADIAVFQRDANGLTRLRTTYHFTGVFVTHDDIVQTGNSQVEHLELNYQSITLTQYPSSGGGTGTVFTYSIVQ
jgi:type VI secretion system Hcp family effector